MWAIKQGVKKGADNVDYIEYSVILKRGHRRGKIRKGWKYWRCIWRRPMCTCVVENGGDWRGDVSEAWGDSLLQRRWGKTDARSERRNINLLRHWIRQVYSIQTVLQTYFIIFKRINLLPNPGYSQLKVTPVIV